MKVLIITDIGQVKHELLLSWIEFIDSHPNGNFFQHPNCHEFFDAISNYQAFTFIAITDEGKIRGILSSVLQKEQGLKSIFSARSIVWGGPIVDNNDFDIITLLISSLIKSIKDLTIYCEIRNMCSTHQYRQAFISNGFNYQAHLNFIVKLDNKINVEKRFSKSKLRQIKSSLKNGAVIQEATNRADVTNFYRILANLYKVKIKKPLPPLEFFIQFLSSEKVGKIFLIKLNNEVIGGILCPIFINKTIYEWFVCGKDGKIKKIYPSVLATWAPIKYGLEAGIQYFDFMGAGSPDSDYGVREFKRGFGGDMLEFGRYIRVNNPILFFIGKIGLKIIGAFYNK